MGRDLLYKPPVPLVVPDEQIEGKKRVQATDKLGLTVRGRDLGGTEDPASKKAPSEAPPAVDKSSDKDSQAPADKAAQTPAKSTRGPAFKAAYFTKDIEATASVNQRTSSMRALRGAEGASDLKKIVLPPSDVETPDPGHLRAASDLMGFGQPPNLAELMQRQGSWVRNPNVTAEMLQQRMAQLEEMVKSRVAALARMAQLPPDRLGRSVTLSRAATAKGAAMDEVEDVVEEGSGLAQDSMRQARGMHKRIAKTLGVKIPDTDD